MSAHARRYVELLERYTTLIHTEYMNEDKRGVMVKEMDQTWNKLNEQERIFMVEVVAQRMYDERLGGECGKSSARIT